MDKVTIEKYIPLDKSWIIRLGVLDILNNYSNIQHFLQNRENLSEDLKALLQVSKEWQKSKEIHVGESGTLFRFLQFASWKYKLNKIFIKERTLIDRKINNNPEIVNLSIKELLKLDNNTTQWASAAILAGNNEKIDNPPYKLRATYEALEHWKESRNKNQPLKPKYDETILIQAETFIKLLKGEKADFTAQQAEDYCFARTFNYISKEEAEKLWPNLAGHETNRFKEMEKSLNELKNNQIINSKDHRVIQAIAMLVLFEKKQVNFSDKECVNKSWPQFWKFLEYCKSN